MSDTKHQERRAVKAGSGSYSHRNHPTFRLPEATLGASNKVRFALQQIEAEELAGRCCSKAVVEAVHQALQASEDQGYKLSAFEHRHLTLYRATAGLHKELGYHEHEDQG